MKSLFFTLLILGAAFVGYDYFLARPWERMIFKKEARPAAAAAPKPTIPDHVVEDDGPAMPSAPAPKISDDGWKPTIPALPKDEFVPPTIPSAEDTTKNWTQIPKQAFPRAVILKKDVQVKMSVGAATLRAGATAQALAAANGLLSIAPTAASSARGVIAVVDTDFPEQIHGKYEIWKTARIEQARQAWLAGKTKVTTPGKDNSTLSNGMGVTFGTEGKPVQNPDGSYNLLLAVISAGKVSDVDPKKVVHWSEPTLKTLDGKPTWVIDVRYEAKTLFGPMEVDSHAHVRGGQFVRWVYDSGEPLP
jgi:hypothetical protein